MSQTKHVDFLFSSIMKNEPVVMYDVLLKYDYSEEYYGEKNLEIEMPYLLVVRMRGHVVNKKCTDFERINHLNNSRMPIFEGKLQFRSEDLICFVYETIEMTNKIIEIHKV